MCDENDPRENCKGPNSVLDTGFGRIMICGGMIKSNFRRRRIPICNVIASVRIWQVPLYTIINKYNIVLVYCNIIRTFVILRWGHNEMIYSNIAAYWWTFVLTAISFAKGTVGTAANFYCDNRQPTCGTGSSLDGRKVKVSTLLFTSSQNIYDLQL